MAEIEWANRGDLIVLGDGRADVWWIRKRVQDYTVGQYADDRAFYVLSPGEDWCDTAKFSGPYERLEEAMTIVEMLMHMEGMDE